MKGTVISYFDYTGAMVRPWADAGYDCFIFDTQHPRGLTQNGKGHNIHTVGGDLFDCEMIINNPKILFSFPPCTDLAVSGASHFKKKAEENPFYLENAMLRVYLGYTDANEWNIPYMIENPVSVISTIWRKPDHIFHPYEYGGYLSVDDEHPLYPEFIAPRDAYTKKTCLWTGNGFVMPEKRPVELPEGYKYSKQHTQLGGKSLKTKNIRSATPRGFAQAVFQANQ